MLVLTRIIGETIVVGDSVRIVVTNVNGNRVKLGIHAPKEIHIVRGELERYDSVKDAE